MILLYLRNTALLSLLSICLVAGIHTAAQEISPLPAYGPYNAVFLPDGVGLSKPLSAQDDLLKPGAAWSMSCWARSAGPLGGDTLIAGIGDSHDPSARLMGIQDGRLMMWFGQGRSVITTGPPLDLTNWRLLASTYDGSTLRLYVDGNEILQTKFEAGEATPEITLAPTNLPWPNGAHFGGHIALFRLQRRALDPAEVKALLSQTAQLSVVYFEEASRHWPTQSKQQLGLAEPQNPSTLPTTKTPVAAAIAQPAAALHTQLIADGHNTWTISGGWQLIEASKLEANSAQISTPGFKATGWMHATVPGTVLTTMVDRGIYPDPDYGLNNFAIPESLSRQKYWYRTDFPTPASPSSRHMQLTLNGINYSADVWLNGQYLGQTTGAFLRGVYDVTGKLHPGGSNSLAILVSPPPHPGIAHEESIVTGPGPNGGVMSLDGPTFLPTEGWDWIPSIRDRDTGLWQDVVLSATGRVSLGDPQVITTLPLPDNSIAKVEIHVPLSNASKAPVSGVLEASFDDVHITKAITVPSGGDTVVLTPAEFTGLTVAHPRLWWPNGYGAPNLYDLALTFRIANDVSDTRKLRFGMRELTYGLSMLDPDGHLRRVNVSPTVASLHGERVVDATHNGIRQIPGGWVTSLTWQGLSSSAVLPADDLSASPFLVIKVNGVRIAVRGGNFGLDDSRKRISRERLEPFFRLHREAHLNMIRNWIGQNTEDVFYDLADEYGLLVWNDFWISTQEWNLEPSDSALFLRNAQDTILRFRNHPSIAVWCGRNEGVPPPTINEGLADLIAKNDGTRLYLPDSNKVDVLPSGPWDYEDPTMYFTDLGRGFSTEIGTPSFPTIETFRTFIPPSEQWPPSDTWSYHDWHHADPNDRAGVFMRTMDTEFGPSSNLEQFERRAQMMNYEAHRAIFEGLNAHLWQPNSGRLLWMTQPAWPSTFWQIFSSNYDTQASYYGVMKASEIVHVQLNLPDDDLAVVNNTTKPLTGLHLRLRVFSLTNDVLLDRTDTLTAAANAVTDDKEAAAYLHRLISGKLVLIKLQLFNSAGDLLSDNFYWQGKAPSSYQALNSLPAANVTASASAGAEVNGERMIRVILHNEGSVAAIENKLTLEDAKDGSLVLPAYFSDNYVSLLPGETRQIDIRYPNKLPASVKVGLRGWNMQSAILPVDPQK